METASAPQRIDAIDQYRGLAILLMVLADFTSDVNRIPGWLKHAEGTGLTVIDVIAPLFIFAIGLTYGPSLRRRIVRSGRWKAYENAIKRYTALIGMGFLLTLGGSLTGVYLSDYNWGLLQAIGMAGLLALPVIMLPAWQRALAGLLLLGSYQVLADRYLAQMVLDSPHGGLPGSFAWGAMLIMATVIADLYYDENRGGRALPWVGLFLTVAGVGLSFVIPVSKNLVSASYVLITLGLSALVFAVFVWLGQRGSFRIPMLTTWGKNPLLLYLLHGVALGLLVLPGVAWWYADAPLWLTGLQAAAMVAALSAVAGYLDRRGLYFAM